MKRIGIVIFILALLLSGCKESYVIAAPVNNQEWNEYVAQAEADYMKGNYAVALENYLNAEAIYRSGQQEESENVAVLYYKIAKCYVVLTDYNAALDNFKKSLAIAEKTKSEDVMLDNYVYILQVYRGVDESINIEDGLQYEDRAVELAIKVYGNPSKELGQAYSSIGDLYYRLERYDVAIERYQKAFEIMGNLFGGQSLEYAEVCISIADCYKKQNDFDNQIASLCEAVEILEKENNALKLAEAYGELGGAYCIQLHEYEKAIIYLDKSIKLSNENGIINTNLAKYYFWKAGTCYNIEDYESFLRDNTKAYKICEALPIQSELVVAIKNLIIGDFRSYYEFKYEGDKTAGFDAWLEELLNK